MIEGQFERPDSETIHTRPMITEEHDVMVNSFLELKATAG
jgi:hypothetical protein